MNAPNSSPELDALRERVLAARADRQPLAIQGGGTKAFYGHPVQGAPLDVTTLAGISSYEPTELVITVRAGTSLAEVEETLAAHGQRLPFEPPRFACSADAARATVGGMVAAGLAGPGRAACGAVSDFVLGATLLNGRGEIVSFGGQVMKNVAGYDVSRLLAGSLGVLGVIAEVSLKVLPRPSATATLRFGIPQALAIKRLNEWGGLPLPITASAWRDDILMVRLSGAGAAVDAAMTRLGGEVLPEDDADQLWTGLRDHLDDYFVRAYAALARAPGRLALWRLSLPQTAPALDLAGSQLIEWGGAQRWLLSELPASIIRPAAQACGGHATLFYAQDKSAGVFTPLSRPLALIHERLKREFDPEGIFNRGRMYAAL